MKKFNTKLIIFSLILASLTTYLGYKYLKGVENTYSSAQLKKILVAAVDIPARTKITSTMIKEIEVNEKSHILDSIQNEEEIIGKFSKERILEDEVIPAERLMEENREELSLRIPENKRAISISIDEMDGVGDLIKATDYVDVYVTLEEKRIEGGSRTIIYPQITKLILENIQVLAVSKEMDRTEDERLETPTRYAITLAVAPYEGEKLIAGEALGRIKLALRSLKDKNTFETPGIIRDDLIPDKGKTNIQK